METITNNEVNVDGKPMTSKAYIDQVGKIIIEPEDHRLLRCDGGNASLLITKEAAMLSHKDSIVHVGKTGILLDGDLHMAAEPNKIRINGFWVFNEEILTTVPSSIYTPIPVLKYDEGRGIKEIQGMIDQLRSLL